MEAVGGAGDADMLATARTKVPHLTWYLDTLATVTLSVPGMPSEPRLFEPIVMAGNVMIFLAPHTEETIIANMACRLAPGRLLVAGFQLYQEGCGLEQYDALATRAVLELAERWAHGIDALGRAPTSMLSRSIVVLVLPRSSPIKARRDTPPTRGEVPLRQNDGRLRLRRTLVGPPRSLDAFLTIDRHLVRR